MLKVRLGAAVSTQFVTLRRVFIATLAMAAILVGLVAMHSAGMVHADAHSEPAATSELSALPAGAAVTSGAAGHAHAETSAGSSTTPLLNCDESCAAECALMALTCMVLFVLSTLILLVRFPAVYRQLIDRGRELIQVPARAATHIYPTSLTVLSISRT